METPIHRRRCLQTGAAAVAALALDPVGLARGAAVAQDAAPDGLPPTRRAAKSFRHRGYLGWITDLATQPDARAAWPSMRLDERLLGDYRATFDLMRRLGLNEISIWGLYVSRAWPVDVSSAVTAERGAMVERLIESAHQHGIRVLSGLGVYSWGFEEIIRAHPKVARGSGQAMCASEPEAWQWMRRVIDFVFARFPIDGVSMQSADQGRCPCPQCRAHSDAEYHALLNTRTSQYIRARWPRKTIGVNSWGMQFGDPAALPSLLEIGRNVDYLIDVGNTSNSAGADYRRELIGSLECAFGTLGGPQVEPPQHWARDRWFLPTAKRTGEHLGQLAADGGAACEYFFHILDNPGDELSLWLAGKVLSDPAQPWQRHLAACVEQLYEVSKPTVRDGLVELFLGAEEAYFRHLAPGTCGTISLEPLVADRPGPPVYIRDRLGAAQRAEYRRELERLKAEAQRLLPEVAQAGRMRKIVRCLDNVLGDLQ